eukprot:GHVT01095002.1.p3 GENE.GHVT01095002.1~~GHVT01095002.1.p3  ORF type:complete len:156 (-),score=32.94 GHVT01095002.1:2458-2925(-)
MLALVAQREVAGRYRVESRGTGGGCGDWYKPNGTSNHQGDPPDRRMLEAASRRKIDLGSRAAPLTSRDLDDFDLIVAMDNFNLECIQEAAEFWGKLPQMKNKVVLMGDFAQSAQLLGKEVPDPYYGGKRGFDHVLDQLSDACQGLLNLLEEQHEA